MPSDTLPKFLLPDLCNLILCGAKGRTLPPGHNKIPLNWKFRLALSLGFFVSESTKKGVTMWAGRTDPDYQRNQATTAQ